MIEIIEARFLAPIEVGFATPMIADDVQVEMSRV